MIILLYDLLVCSQKSRYSLVLLLYFPLFSRLPKRKPLSTLGFRERPKLSIINITGLSTRYTGWYSVCFPRVFMFNALINSCMKYENYTHFIRAIFPNSNLTAFGYYFVVRNNALTSFGHYFKHPWKAYRITPGIPSRQSG